MDGALQPNHSVIVPCFNEEGAIASTIKAISATLKDRGPFEILIVDDGSTDGSATILEQLKAQHLALRIIPHSRNFGYGAALKTGIIHARSNVIVITDADGTYPIDRIPDLLREMEAGADMVVGARIGADVTYSMLRRIPKVFLKAYVAWIAGQPVADMNSGLRAFRRDVAEQFLAILPDSFSFTTTITLAMLTNRHRVVYMPISYAKRTGQSKIKPVRDTLRFLQLIMRTGMYFAPLRVFFPFAAMLGLAFGASFIYDVFQGNLTDKTVLLFLFAMNTGMFALLADMIHRRIGR